MIDVLYKDNILRIGKFEKGHVGEYKDAVRAFYIQRKGNVGRLREGWYFLHFNNLQYLKLKIFDKKEIVIYCIEGLTNLIKKESKYISTIMKLSSFRETL